MTLHLHRFAAVADATIGILSTGGRFICWTLEDQRRPGQPKVPAETAIPAGTYPLQVTQSPRFRKPLPLVGKVPGFSGIRIHAGNTTKDTEGCILVGLRWRDASVLQSKLALDTVMDLLGTSAHTLVIHDPAEGVAR